LQSKYTGNVIDIFGDSVEMVCRTNRQIIETSAPGLFVVRITTRRASLQLCYYQIDQAHALTPAN